MGKERNIQNRSSEMPENSLRCPYLHREAELKDGQLYDRDVEIKT